MTTTSIPSSVLPSKSNQRANELPFFRHKGSLEFAQEAIRQVGIAKEILPERLARL
jgi:hypothetical protein